MKLCMGCMESYEDSYNICPYCGYVENSETEEANQLQPGTILHYKYVIGKAIGHGGFGVTYIGYDAELERKIAIKEYMPNEFSNRIPGENRVIIYEGDKREQFENGLTKFTEEARRLAMFQDKEGIVQIYDCFLENNTAYLVMEYLNGITVKDKIKRDGKMTLENALGIIMPILRSLKEVNAAGILHRDIAPDNILITNDGEAKLFDFGASRFATTGHSRSLTVLIKQGFAPVEQYNSRGDQGTWTDVYGLAATFYFLLTGKTPQDAMERKAHDQLKPPSKEGASVKKNIDTAILNALNVGIEYRTKTMEDFEKELLAIDEVARVVEPNHMEDVGKMPKWLKASLIIVAALVLIFGVLLTTGVINFGGVASGTFQMTAGNTYVPTFVNQNYENAGNIAKENQLLIQIVDSRFSDEIEKEMVLAQSKPSGSEVLTNSMIDLVVSAGREQTEIPYLLGMNITEAVSLLHEMGLDVEALEVDNNAIEGSIVTQSIDAMTLVDRGSKIRLEISNGNLGDIDIEQEVIVPDLVKKKYEEAQLELSKLGLQVSRSTQYSNDVAEGLIISQSEPAGTVLHQGEAVNLVVSLGKQMVNIPYVVFKTEADAKTILRDAGLRVVVDYDYSDAVQRGNVISQSIAEGSKVTVNTEVKLVVSMGPKENMFAQATPEPQWSGWLEMLPTGVSSSNHQVETKMQYRYQDLVTTSTTDKNLGSQGWTQVGEPVQSYGEWGTWSGWSDAEVTSSDKRDVKTRTVYRYQTKQTKTSNDTSPASQGWTQVGNPVQSYGEWGNWSNWGDDEVSATATKDVEERTVYRSRTKQTKTSNDTSPASQGWTQVGEPVKIYGDYGPWSEWSDEPVTASDTRKVGSRKMYQYRDKETTTANTKTLSGWTYDKRTQSEGAWSEWSRTPITASETEAKKVEVKTQTGTESVQTGTVYHYYAYVINGYKGLNWTYSYNYYVGAQNAGYNPYTITKDTDTYYNDRNDVDSSGVTHPGFNSDGHAWWYLNSEPKYEDVSYTEYSSRTITYTYHFYKYSPWSDWSETKPTNVAGREIQEKTQYKHRDRSVITTYNYEKWESWSDWQTTEIAEIQNQIEVQNKKQYHYREREVILTYSYEKWDDWSGWSTSAVSASSNKKVEQKTQYRFREKGTVLTYTFQKWGEWSEWSDLGVSKSSTRNIETRVLYRYK